MIYNKHQLKRKLFFKLIWQSEILTDIITMNQSINKII